jgi:hypothetical protein
MHLQSLEKAAYSDLRGKSWVPVVGLKTTSGENLENIMKKLALAAVFAGAASTAMAGSYAKDDVMMEPVVVVEEAAASSSAAGILIPLLLVAVIAAVAAD